MWSVVHFFVLFRLLYIHSEHAEAVFSTTVHPNGTSKELCQPIRLNTEWDARDYPDPQSSVRKCGRNCKKSWICDPSEILDHELGTI